MKIQQAISYFIISLGNQQLSEHSIRAYKQDLDQFYLAVSKEDLEQLSFEVFQNYFMQIIHLRPSSVKRKQVVLHRFLKFCYQKKLCNQKLYEFIDPIRSKKTSAPKEVLTKEEISCLFSYLTEQKEEYFLRKEHPYYEYLYYCSIRNILLISILLYTGCRAQEVVSIKKGSVSFDQNSITLFTKGKKYNQVPIHDELLNAFSSYDDAASKIQSTELAGMLQSQYLFPSRQDTNKHMAARTLHDLMKTLSKVMNRHIHAHLFRHTFASYCIAANMDISTISSLISHSNPAITLSVYTHEINAHHKQLQIKKLSFT